MHTFETIEPAGLSLAPLSAIDKGWMLLTAVKPDGTFNTMTASWGGLGTLWNAPVAFVFVRPSRYTKEFIDADGTVSLSLFKPGAYRRELGLLGTKSGRDGDKIAESGLTVVHEGEVPYFAEAGAVLIGTKLYAQLLTEECFTAQGIARDLPHRMYEENPEGWHTMYVIGIDKVLVAR